MLNLLAKLFGTKSDKDIKGITPYVIKINEIFSQLYLITDDQLRNKSVELKQKIADHLSTIDNSLQELENKSNSTESVSIEEKEQVFNQIDKLKKDKDIELEKVLLEILPEAFAVCKETARRFKENGQIVVSASDWDKTVAAKRAGVTIDGDKAIWSKKWLAAGVEISWEMVHYDVQLIGGVALHTGKISEMSTGEGKTLVATLPLFLNALAGQGVHVVTVNDYLAKRDSEWNAPLFEFHGLKVDCIDKHTPHSEERKNAYLADITYGTNNEFGFDYLRDNMVHSRDEMVQRKHHFAIVDEVDSVLIDDARTPLIISGPVPRGDEQMFYELKPKVVQLYDAQKKLAMDCLNEAKRNIEDGRTDEKTGGLNLIKAHRALPKYKPLIKYLSEPGIKAILQKTENYFLQDNSKEMPKVDKELYFTIDEKSNSVNLNDKGIDLITGASDDPHFFILPDIGAQMGRIEKDKNLSAEEKLELTEKMISDYKLKSECIHTVNQLLKAYTMFEKEIEYLVVDGKVKLVDENTGRIMDGRRYSDGLHQAIEAKENVKVEEATQTYATITLQNFFRMYHKLCGMTGTASTESGEFWEIYKLDVITIPTNVVAKRKDQEDKVYKTVREKFNAVVDEISNLNKIGRPVLVGTTSVEVSEVLSRMLSMRKVKHNVLNAKYHAKEAEIVAEAGQVGAVTIATNMAGRGTDIKLSDEAKSLGGLAIIGTERHESRRVDRQLRGRAGRQGDPGSSQFFVSLEDYLMRLFGSDRIAKYMDKMGLDDGEVIQHSIITNSIERAQKKVEENNFGVRKRLLEYDDVMNMQRKAIYSKRKNALFGDRLQVDVEDMLFDMSAYVVGMPSGSEYENFKFNYVSTFSSNPTITIEEYSKLKADVLTRKVYSEVSKSYQEHKKHLAESTRSTFSELYIQNGDRIENVVMPITDGKREIQILVPLKKAYENQGLEIGNSIEKHTVLSFIDQEWKEHLREMDDLKQSVQNAVYEQKDPLLVYKGEAYKMFNSLINKLNQDSVAFLTKAVINVNEKQDLPKAKRQALEPKLVESHESYHTTSTDEYHEPREEAPKLVPIRSEKIFGRNDTVTVQYADGRTKTDKFKKLEDDIMNLRCVVV